MADEHRRDRAAFRLVPRARRVAPLDPWSAPRARGDRRAGSDRDGRGQRRRRRPDVRAGGTTLRLLAPVDLAADHPDPCRQPRDGRPSRRSDRRPVTPGSSQRRFGTFWARFSVGCLFLLNLLTICTEFIGVSYSLGYLGVSKYLSIPHLALPFRLRRDDRDGQLPPMGAVHVRVRRRQLPHHSARDHRPSLGLGAIATGLRDAACRRRA